MRRIEEKNVLPAGKAIKEMRKRAGMSQLNLAREVDLDVYMLRLFESGNLVPSIPYLQMVGEALDVQVWEIIREAENIKENE